MIPDPKQSTNIAVIIVPFCLATLLGWAAFGAMAVNLVARLDLFSPSHLTVCLMLLAFMAFSWLSSKLASEAYALMMKERVKGWRQEDDDEPTIGPEKPA